jgi:hypothetical protein
MVRKDTRSRFLPIIIAMAFAVLGLIGLLLVNHGPWTKPKVQNEAMIQDGTTADQRRLLVQPSLLPNRS